MKDSNLRFPRSKQGGIAASPMRDKTGIPGGTRTPTNSFGDCYAAITLPRYKIGIPPRTRTLT